MTTGGFVQAAWSPCNISMKTAKLSQNLNKRITYRKDLRSVGARAVGHAPLGPQEIILQLAAAKEEAFNQLQL